jgi:hypothetical protein
MLMMGVVEEGESTIVESEDDEDDFEEVTHGLVDTLPVPVISMMEDSDSNVVESDEEGGMRKKVDACFELGGERDGDELMPMRDDAR